MVVENKLAFALGSRYGRKDTLPYMKQFRDETLFSRIYC